MLGAVKKAVQLHSGVSLPFAVSSPPRQPVTKGEDGEFGGGGVELWPVSPPVDFHSLKTGKKKNLLTHDS